jgi:hypothetical protein
MEQTQALRALEQIEGILLQVYEQQPVGADWRAALVTICGLLAEVKTYLAEEKDASQ